MKENIKLSSIDEGVLEVFKKEVYPKETKTIYHYTTLKNLQSIICKKKLGLTNVEFLNDYTEFDHGLKRFSKYSKEKYWNSFTSFKDGLYIGSFCSKENDLSLWRLYADGAKGVSIGFNIEKLIEYLKGKKSDFHFLLGQCVYREKEKKMFVKKYHDKKLSVADFCLIGSLFKSSYFRAEKEIRLAIMHISGKTKFISYGFSQDLYKRFYDLDLNNKLFDCISEIVIGPAGDQTVIERSIKLMFEEKNQKCCRIEKSKIPYRLI